MILVTTTNLKNLYFLACSYGAQVPHRLIMQKDSKTCEYIFGYTLEIDGITVE